MSPVGRRASKIFRSVVQCARQFGDVLCATFLANILGLALPLSLLQVYDRILPNRSVDTTMLLTLGVLTAIAAEAFVRWTRSVFLSRRSASAELKLSNAAIRHLLDCDLAEFERVGTGAHLERMSAVSMLREQLGGQSVMALFDMPFAFLYLLVLGVIGGRLVLVPLAALALFIPLAIRSGGALHRALAALGVAESERSDFVVAALSGIQTAKCLAAETALISRYQRLNRERALQGSRVEILTQDLAYLSQMTVQAVTVAGIAFGSLAVIHGRLSVGGISACVLLSGRILQPFQTAVGFWTRLQSLRAARGQAEALFDLAAVAPSQRSLADLIDGSLTLNAVSCAGLFSGVQLTVNPGDRIAIVGPSGGGKSRLLSVMAGLCAPDGGAVLLDEQPLTDFAVAARETTIAIVAQQETLFRGTIMENLTGFRADLEGAAQDIAEELGAGELIRALPLGFQTAVGDTAVEALPRGLAQQVAIARALVTPPRILLFDDADTALDDHADGKLRTVLSRLAPDSALVLVSHRPAMLKLANRIYRLSAGKLDIGLREVAA